MTTPQAEKLYEAQHLNEMSGKKNAVYNPENKALEDLPVIYGFNNGGGPCLLLAQLLAEDGTALGSHGCSSEAYMPHDLGILEGTRPDRHEDFKKHYPGGYRMEFIHNLKNIDDHEGLKKAYELNQEQAQRAAKEET